MNQFKTDPNDSDENGQCMQKLVDGELRHDARSQWLAGLSYDSTLWRDMALAFVEKQVTDEALRDFVIADAVTRGSKQSMIPIAIQASSLTTTDSQDRWRISMWFAGLATCLLVGFFVGAEFKTSLPDTNDTQQMVASRPAKLSTQGSDAPALAIGLADALSRSSAPVPNEFRRALLKAGYALKDRQAMTNVMLPSGGQIELPIRDVDVTFVGMNSFQ